MSFDIVTYLNNLPSCTIDIDVSNKGLTYLPDLSRFKRLQVLNCQNNQLTSLPPFNPTLERVNCRNNKLTSLPPFNKNLLDIECSRNELTVLPTLNKKLIYLDCGLNQLTALPELKHLKNLCHLNIYSNRIHTLPALNEGLKYFEMAGNKFDVLLPLYFHSDMYYSKLYFKKKDIVKINKWIHFREYYFLSKLKSKFLSWMWKAREKQIQQKYHPSKLIAFLQTVDDEDGEALDNFIDAWIK